MASYNENTKAIQFSDREGLPQNIVTCYTSDNYGYGWVGTGNGIARFDGYDFITYKMFEGRVINSILCDIKNQIWVGADNGLYLYDRIKDSFSLVFPGFIKQLSSKEGDIYFMLQNRLIRIDSSGNPEEWEIKGINAYTTTNEGVWINSGNKGIRLLNGKENYLNKRVISLIRQIDDNLLIACRNGDLFRLSSSTEIQRIKIKNRDYIRDIELINNEIWLATDGNGIIILNKNFELVRHLKKEHGKTVKIPSNSIYDISEGLNGTIWISTYGAGLICLVPENKTFVNIVPSPGNSNSLIDKEGISAYVKENIYYLGTNYGLTRLNNEEDEYFNVNSNSLQQYLQGNKVTAVTADDKYTWIGTYDGFLGKFDKDLNFIQSFHPCSDRANEMQRIVFLYDYSDDFLFIGTQFHDRSLIKWNKNTNEFQILELDSRTTTPKNFPVNSIRKNQQGEVIALIRNLGIFRYNKTTERLEGFEQEINNRITFKLNDFYHDKEGFYWFTTQANGLIRLSPDGQTFDKWTVEQGFPTNSLLRIESTDDRILWISSIVGLCRFDMQTKQIQIFNFQHGLASNEFAPRTSTVTNDKRIIFGNSEGFSIINPTLLEPDTSKTKVIISDIRFHNQSIKKLKQKLLADSPLEEAKKLVLPYSHNSFSISFFTKDNYLPKFNNFAYRLKGLEEDWIYLGETNHTTYTNLTPGKYTFQVKSTNKSNIWNEKFSNLEIHILPPWYLTKLAFLSYLVIIILNIILVLRIYKRRLLLKKEVEISEYKVKKEHELTENKLAFFTNISHDLKTPLTLISAPINEVLLTGNLDNEQKQRLNVAKRNASRLYKLISDLIDFRKISQRQLPLMIYETDLQPIIENIFESFRMECKKRDMEFTYEYNITGKVFVDSKKVEKILWNLLANAIKFTPDSGKVWLKIQNTKSDQTEFINFEVGDTGKGMNENEKQKIFDRFYQIRKSDNIRFDGSGIGLSIVNDLVQLHHGKIDIESQPDEGSRFNVYIPAEKKAYSSDEISSIAQESSVSRIADVAIEFPDEKITNESNPERRYNLPKLLIVEDNKEMLDYLVSYFSKTFEVFHALEGKTGLEIAVEKEPDLILSDVQMPVMGGIEFSKKIRDNYNLSHTPILMLTAASATEKKVEGLLAGADSYVTKPFEIAYLDAVAKSLLENRKRAKEKFLGIEQIKENPGNYNPADIDFINQLKDYIFENITNEDLNIDLLSQHFSISLTHLNRKIKALTNTTPNNYIRTIRLKKAYELIKNKKMRVSEAAYATGFTDPNYFTYCFKKEFGENPSKI